ncbi:MAG: SpoIIE family protein phosphatase [Bacteroidia bacterium]|nr:SpoIIE family protein phosphatase [Bacteroidia bacterium]
MSRKALGFLLLGWVWAQKACEACGIDALCLGKCAYERLLAESTPRGQAEAYLLLAHAWLRGGFTEGVPRLVHEALRRISPPESLFYHGQALLAQAHYALGRPDSAIFLYEKIATEAQAYPFLVGRCYLALGSHYAGSEPLRAQGYAAQAVEKAEAVQHPILQALAYNQLSFLVAASDIERAIQYAQKALEVLGKPAAFHLLLEPAERVRPAVVANLASLYAERGRWGEAEKLYQQALAEARGDSVAIGQALLGLSQLYLAQRKLNEAQRLLAQARGVYARLPYSLRREWLRTQASLAIAQGKLKEALNLYERLVEEAERQSITQQNERIAQLSVLSGLEAREAELKALQEQRRRERLLYGLIGIFGLLFLGGLGYALAQARRRAREERTFRETIAAQAQRIEEQARALERQNEELVRISETLAEALSTLQESHSAARRLQRAILPNLERFFPGIAVYYEPMQEVGGDFYTMAADPFSKRLLLVVGDCTGHGVSEAILAGIFAATAQNLFLQNPNQTPQALLQRLRQALDVVLRGEVTEGHLKMREGADLAVAIVDFPQQKVLFGLAGRPVWVYDRRQGFRELPGGRRGIDSFTTPEYEFPAYEEPLTEDRIFYFFTDGLTDVLNPEGKKLGIKALRALGDDPAFVASSPKKQLEKVVETIKNWQGKAPPNDDVTLLIVPAQALLAYARDRFKLFV